MSNAFDSTRCSWINFSTQELANGHRVYVIGQDPYSSANDIMWFLKSLTQESMAGDSDEEEKAELSQKVKIAWRYENMKQFYTIVEFTI